ncbi:MAG: DUF1624 domain-containing protein [Planctomycetes bacterium]|nr:DUF1624 domain-containing protein [Planctomycetota bacterium]MCP4771996.1 DUF1624 domain-containing protein [Planctomycetota bacterium]MCP4860264.1 DUF1624 domain-containing protein [Planctomycetota bacterium]
MKVTPKVKVTVIYSNHVREFPATRFSTPTSRQKKLTDSYPKPGASGSKRILGFDLARALAVFGMVLVNFKVVMGAGNQGPDWLVQLASLFDGRAAALFVVLAGVGIALMSKRARETGDPTLLAANRRTLLKRATFLFVVGLLYMPLWPADILHLYGVYLALAALALGASAKRIVFGIALVVIAFAVMMNTLNYSQGWNWPTLSYSGFWTPAGMLRHTFFNGFHPVLPWIAFLLLGMLLGRIDLASSPRARRRVFLCGIGVMIAAESISWILVDHFSQGANFLERIDVVSLYGTEPMPPMPLYMFSAGGLACSIIAVAVALGERFPHARWVSPLVATGQLTLTLYVAHVVIGMGILESAGRLENQSLPFAFLAAATFCTISMVLSFLYRKRFQHGPLEAMMRFLTR